MLNYHKIKIYAFIGMLLSSMFVSSLTDGHAETPKQNNMLLYLPTIVSAASNHDSPIVGGWGTGYYASGVSGSSEPEYMSITFYPNGYYIHYESGQASEPCDTGGGVEYGTYTFDTDKQQISVSPIVDNNGCVGLAENGVGGTYAVTINEDSLQFVGDTVSFKRVD